MPLSAGQVSVSPVLQMVKLRRGEVQPLAQGCAVSGDRSRIRAAIVGWQRLRDRAAHPAVPVPAVSTAQLSQTENLVSHLQGKSSCPLSTIKSLNIVGVLLLLLF